MKSVKKIMALMALSAVSVAGSGAAFADESQPKNFSVTVGVKAWATDWETWGGFGAAKATAVNPSVTVKYKNFFISGGMMPNTKYTIVDTAGFTLPVKRKEMDLSLGYYIHPQVALTLGYKKSTQIFDYTSIGFGLDTYEWTIPAIGISGAAPIQETKMFMYGNAAFGKASIKTSTTMGAAPCQTCTGGTYTTSEFGMGYSFTNSFRATLGYKYQIIPTTMPAGATKITQFDATRGFVFGGSYTF